jgi:hypothetical protein
MAENKSDLDSHILLNGTNIMAKKSRCKEWLIREEQRWSSTQTS